MWVVDEELEPASEGQRIRPFAVVIAGGFEENTAPVVGLLESTAVEPVRGQSSGEPQRETPVVVDPVREGEPEIVVVRLEHDGALVVAHLGCASREPRRVPASLLELVSQHAQSFSTEAADRLEHPVAVGAVLGRRDGGEALVEQGLEQVEIGVGDVARLLQRAAAGEDAQGAKSALLLGLEEVVRPGDGRRERALAGVDIARAAREQRQTLIEPLEDRARGERAVRAAASSIASGSSSSAAQSS